jgi:DNA-binding NarL/FixJ family response regulator
MLRTAEPDTLRRPKADRVGGAAAVDQATPLRVLIAHSQSLFREALRAVLESQSDLEIVAEARNGADALHEAERVQPDVCLIDAELPNGDGIRTTAFVHRAVPDCAIVVLADSEDLDTLVEALEAGASAFLSKESPLLELIAATREVHAGATLVPPRMLGALIARLIQHKREQEEAMHRLSRLTKREREVLGLLAAGANNDSIAQALVVSPQTARTHIQNVLSKLDVHSRLEAAMFVTHNDIMSELSFPDGREPLGIG